VVVWDFVHQQYFMASPKKTQKSEEKLSAKKSHANEHRRLLDKARAG